MANGKIIIGYSKPYIAGYSAAGSSVTYKGAIPLARGVSVKIDPTVGDDDGFYADNVLAESAGGVLTGGTLTLSVDGLKDAARKLAFGTPEETQITLNEKQYKVKGSGKSQTIPYVGVGFLIQYMEESAISYTAFIVTKVKFNETGLSAETQGKSINYQAQELTAKIMRDDTEARDWKRYVEDIADEAEAEKVLKELLGGAGA